MAKFALVCVLGAVAGAVGVRYGFKSSSVVMIGPEQSKAIKACNDLGLDGNLDTVSNTVSCIGATK